MEEFSGRGLEGRRSSFEKEKNSQGGKKKRPVPKAAALKLAMGSWKPRAHGVMGAGKMGRGGGRGPTGCLILQGKREKSIKEETRDLLW